MIVEYCQCVDLMPMLTTDIMTKLFELMKVGNIYIYIVHFSYRNSVLTSYSCRTVIHTVLFNICYK